MTVKRIEMALHVQELCAVNDIKVVYQSLEDAEPRYWARPRIKLLYSSDKEYRFLCLSIT